MSTVLTNGIIIPDNGSRNWGGDLANNWNILDVHVGYMTNVKNRVTTLENSVTTLETSVAENTANIEINTSNISALQTSKQNTIEDLETIRAGASAGATAVQPSTLNNYYTKTETDTKLSEKSNIVDSVLKTNTDYIFRDYNLNTLNIDEKFNENYTASISEEGHGTRPVGGWTQIINFNASHFIMQLCSNNGTSDLYVRSRHSAPDRSWCDWGKLADDGAVVHKSGDTMSGDLLGNGSANLGTSTNKWKTINGINPGALSLPNYSQYINISFAVETPIAIPENGFLSVTLNVENNSYVNVFVNDLSVYILQSALKPTVGAFIPVSANDIVKIHVADGSYTGYGYLVLYKNKGNV